MNDYSKSKVIESHSWGQIKRLQRQCSSNETVVWRGGQLTIVPKSKVHQLIDRLLGGMK